jgi:hypothetical protein
MRKPPRLRCPAGDCTGGQHRLQRALSDAARDRIANEAPPGLTGPAWQWFRCGYCSTVWVLRIAPEAARVVRVLGYFDRDGGSFVADSQPERAPAYEDPPPPATPRAPK